MPDYTPGPWTAHHQDGVSYIAANTKIANVYSTAFRDAANQQANANLISAAPDLLEALKAAKAWMRSLGIQDADDDLIAVVDLMDAAIAKAEGKS